MSRLVDAERAATNWLQIRMLRDELSTRAVKILEHRRGGSELCSNDFKAAWANLCRNSSQMDSGQTILGTNFSDSSDSEDSLYDPYSDHDDMSVDEPQDEDSRGSGCQLELDEELIVFGPDSKDGEPENEGQEGTGAAEKSVVGNDEQEMVENMSTVANALLESVAPPQAFNQLQVRSPARLSSFPAYSPFGT